MSAWFREYGWGAVAPALFTGSYPQDAADVAALHSAGITAVINLCRDEEYRSGARVVVAAAYADAGIVEHRFSSVDYGGLAPALLERSAATAAAALDAGHAVYVHCRAGWQRSATVAAATLVVRDGVGATAALRAIRRRRPEARPLPHQVEDLLAWQAGRQSP